MNVLVADDEPAILRAVSRLLERSGHTVRTADTADEAVSLLSLHTFDVVLVDHNMPGDGRTVLEALRRLDGFEGRAFLMSGAPPDPSDPLPAGVEHVQKPFDFEVLLALIAGG